MRSGRTPDDAVRRAVRAFALVCAVLAGAAVGGAAPAHAAAAVAAVMVAGALHVVAERYADLSELMPAGDRLPVQPWLLAVGAVVAAILVVAAFAGLLLDSDVLHRALGSRSTSSLTPPVASPGWSAGPESA